MPTYEYRCTNGHDFEEFFLRMSASKPELPCPTCGERGERRMSAGGGLLFKGSGFYITDYGKDGKKAANARAESRSGEGASGDSAKSESAAFDASKGDSSKSESSKSETTKSEASKSGAAKSESSSSSASKSESKPSSAPAAPPAKGKE